MLTRYIAMNAILRISGYCLLLIMCLSGCFKQDSLEPNSYGDALQIIAKQDLEIQDYMRSHNLQLKKDPSGLYYKILASGDSTTRITPNTIPSIIFSRRTLDDSLLDASFGATDFDGRKLQDYIIGWQIGLQKIGKGGKIFMIIPSPLAFDDQRVGNIIPANTILVCDIELVDCR